MEIRYCRSLKASHMIIEKRSACADWEKEMLEHHRSGKFIVPEDMGENGKEYLWYDITGRQALDVIADAAEVDYELFCRICEGAVQAAEQAEQLLVEADAILLLPECIFLDHQTQAVRFCYYPGSEETFSAAFHKLLEYLLAKLDHQDQRAVAAAYRLYEITGVEGYCMSEIHRALQYECVPEEAAECEETSAVLTQKTEEGAEAYISCMTEQKKRKWQLPDIGAVWKHFWSKKSGHRGKKQDEPFVFEPEETASLRQTHPTVLLSELTNKTAGILKYEGMGAACELKIDHTPYIIGSDAACDGVISGGTVSRRHAKITQKEDVYFIEDLNSSNGTYVGGELINCRVKMSLQPGEIVAFANEKFRFI